jgi:hypothetical protein
MGQSDLSPAGRGTGTEVGNGAPEGGVMPWGGVPVPMGKGGVMPVGCGRATLMGEAAARAARVAMRSVFAYILVVGWVLAGFGRVVDFDAFRLDFLLCKVAVE